MSEEYGKKKAKAGIFTPTLCDVYGCGCEAHRLITVVKNQHDKTVCGSFSQFGLTTKPLKVDARYTFIKFIARCGTCVTNDMIHAGVVTGEVRRDHMENYQEEVF